MRHMGIPDTTEQANFLRFRMIGRKTNMKSCREYEFCQDKELQTIGIREKNYEHRWADMEERMGMK